MFQRVACRFLDIFLMVVCIFLEVNPPGRPAAQAAGDGLTLNAVQGVNSYKIVKFIRIPLSPRNFFEFVIE